MKVTIITSGYTCDICDNETDTTPGNLPSGWVSKKIPVSSSIPTGARHEVHIGPICKASSDPQILLDIKTLLLG